MPSTPQARLEPVKRMEELREMFTHGVSLEDFRKYYHQYQRGVETHAEFRKVDEAIQFLEDHGGYTYPEPKAGAWITEGEAWVAVDGYLPLHKHPPDWFARQVQFKYLVNVVGVHTRVLIFDDCTAGIWEHLCRSSITYDKALHWTLLARPLLPDDAGGFDIAREVQNQIQTGEDPARAIRNGRLGLVLQNCHIPSIEAVLNGEWVPAPRSLFWFDGYHHLLLMPSWVFKLNMSYSIREWTYFL